MGFRALYIVVSILALQYGFATYGLAEISDIKPLHFVSLPNEMQAMVFNHLPCYDLMRARSVCSAWNETIQSTATDKHFLRTPNDILPRTGKAKFSPDGQFIQLEGVTKDLNSVVSIYSGLTGQHLRDFSGLHPVFSLDGESILMTETEQSGEQNQRIPSAVSLFNLNTGERTYHFSLKLLSENQRKQFEYGRYFFANVKEGVFFYSTGALYYLDFEDSQMTEVYIPRKFDYIRSVRLSPDHKNILLTKASFRSSNLDGSSIVIDTSTLKVRYSTRGKTRYLLNGKFIASAQFHHLDIHNIETGKWVSRIPFGGFLSGKSDSRFYGVWMGAHQTKVWDFNANKSVMELPALSSEIYVSPNEEKVIIYDKKLKRLTCYSEATGLPLNSLSASLESVYKKNQNAFSTNSQYFAVNTKDGDILVWDLNSGEVTELKYPVRNASEGDSARINSVSFSPDHRSLLVSYKAYGVTLLWRLR